MRLDRLADLNSANALLVHIALASRLAVQRRREFDGVVVVVDLRNSEATILI